MIKSFCGTTLIDILLKKFDNIQLLKNKFISLYDEELIDIAQKYSSVKIYRRSEKSATSDGPIDVIWEWAKEFNYKFYIYVNACSPLLSEKTICDFIIYFLNSPHQSLFAVKKIRDYFWNENGELFLPKCKTTILNTKSKDLPTLYLAAHTLYAGRLDDIVAGVQLGDFSYGYPEIYPLNSKIEILDIDDKEDFQIAEAVYKEKFGHTLYPFIP